MKPEPCGCEHEAHFSDAPYSAPTPQYRHDFLGVPAGAQVARYVGPVCDDCATECVPGFIVH